jgi:thiamine biosynthesis lipoprotein
MKRSRIPGLLVIIVMVAVMAASPRADGATSGDRRPVVFRTRTMGTWASLTMVTADSAAVADLALESLLVLHHVDSLMSNWTQSSEVARINREAGKAPAIVEPEVAAVIGAALETSRESDGAFDITVEPLVRLWGFLDGTPHVPSQKDIDRTLQRVGSDKLSFNPATRTIRFSRPDVRIDLGGIAKGYGADQVAVALRAGGTTDALVDLSGNMVAIGNAATHAGWNVGIRDPAGVYAMLGKITLHDDAVATSGDYEQFVDEGGRRHGHIIDPRTGWSARGLSSVTIVAANAMTADAWATALFVLGPKAARDLARARSDIAAVLIEPVADGTTIIWVEESLRGRFGPEESLPPSFTTRYF